MKRLIVVAALTLAGADVAAAEGALHPPISIQSDMGFSNCSCVTSGAGTTSSPYVIGPMSINSVAGDAVYIDGTSLTKSFVLSNLTIAGASAQNSHGIVLVHINPSGTQSIIASSTLTSACTSPTQTT